MPRLLVVCFKYLAVAFYFLIEYLRSYPDSYHTDARRSKYSLIRIEECHNYLWMVRNYASV